MDTIRNFPQPKSAPKSEIWVFCPEPINILLKLMQAFTIFAHFCLNCLDWRWSKTHRALGWLRQEAGGGREYWLMLISFASLCQWAVKAPGSAPPCSDYRRNLNWTLVGSLPHDATCRHWHQTLVLPSNIVRPLIICQLLTLTRRGIKQRWQTTVTTRQRGHCLWCSRWQPSFPCLWSLGSSMWHHDRAVMWQRAIEREEGSERG